MHIPLSVHKQRGYPTDGCVAQKDRAGRIGPERPIARKSDYQAAPDEHEHERSHRKSNPDKMPSHRPNKEQHRKGYGGAKSERSRIDIRHPRDGAHMIRKGHHEHAESTCLPKDKHHVSRRAANRNPIHIKKPLPLSLQRQIYRFARPLACVNGKNTPSGSTPFAPSGRNTYPLAKRSLVLDRMVRSS